MKVQIEKLPKSTVKVNVVVETSKVKEMYDHVLDEAVENAELEGFRKGKAPKDLVRDKVGVSKLYGEVINHLLQSYYPLALKENHINPLSNPRVEIKEFDLEKDFEFTATVALRPEVVIKDFAKELRDTLKSKVEEKRKLNEEKIKKGEPADTTDTHLGSNDVIDAVIKNASAEIPDILAEEETDRMMARLVDQASAIGISLEQYLKTQNKTSDQLRHEYMDMARKNLLAEFALAKLVMEQKVEIDDKEIDAMVAAVGDPAVQERFKEPLERYYIKSILQKNKLITKLIEEAENENK